MVELSVSHLWRTGPDWLAMEVSLGSNVEPNVMPEQCSQELCYSTKLSHSLVTVEIPTIGTLLDCENFSIWTRLIRVSAWVLKAVAQFKAKKNSPHILTVHEVTAAELLWLLHAQGALTQHKDFDSLKHQLGLFLDDKGLWRCGGRLRNVELPYSTKYPILLPHGHPVSALIVSYAHRCVCHNGVKETLTQVRMQEILDSEGEKLCKNHSTQVYSLQEI